MNRTQANEWRVAHGLAPMVETKTSRAQRINAAHNAAKRAEDNRALRRSRSGSGKGKGQ